MVKYDKIRNPNIENRGKFETRNPRVQANTKALGSLLVSVIGIFCHWALFLISDLSFRFSNAIRLPPYVLASSILLTALHFVFTPMALADDVGITKARLIQKSAKSYLVEADVSRALVWAIKAPIFPDRFQVSELEFINQSGWIVVQATATTVGKPLTAREIILLPWMRNGVALTVQWQDGTIRQGLFLRSLDGIHVPLRLLMESSRSLSGVCVQHFKTGVQHLAFKGIHLLLVAALFLVFTARQAFKALGYYAFGQALSLVLYDFGLTGFDLLMVDILGIVLVFLVAVAATRQLQSRQYLLLVAVYGLLHGLAYAHELTGQALPLDYRVPALFMGNLAIDAGHFAVAGGLLATTRIFRAGLRWKQLAAYAAGTLSVTLLLTTFHERVITGKTVRLAFGGSQITTRFALPASQKIQAGGQRPPGARQLTSPIMTYLSVEPYEVRQEVLIQARAAVQFLGADDRGKGSVPINSLAPVKQGILTVFQEANPTMIDGKLATPVLARADFVTLGAGGVILRPNPVAESLDEGIIALSLVYETPELADEIEIDWRLFSKHVQKVEATSIDPFGGATQILSPDKNRWYWKSRLSGYRVPVIGEIAVKKKKLPVISILLLISALVLTSIAAIRKRKLFSWPLLGIAGIGFVLYPFATYPLDLPWVSHWTPSPQRTAIILDGLLTNVYRAFDVRDESRVYDRLAVSVTGDQLTRIYLENRKSLEFENRGGARANMDEVKMLAVTAVKGSTDDGFVADARWTVSGSVSHFGHTHYRRNQYHAMVTFTAVNGFWKIRDIELVDEKRLL